MSHTQLETQNPKLKTLNQLNYQEMNKIEACIFDLDGVICDTAKYHFKAWQRLANSLGFDFTEEENEQLKGVSRVESLNLILNWGGKDKIGRAHV